MSEETRAFLDLVLAVKTVYYAGYADAVLSKPQDIGFDDAMHKHAEAIATATTQYMKATS